MSDKLIVANIDYNDHVWGSDELYLEPRIAELLENCARQGVGRVHWRTSCLGLGSYRSDVLRRTDHYDAEEARANSPEKWLEQIDARIENAEKHRRVLEAIDPPEVAARHARRLGMEIYIWITIFDDYFPGYRGVYSEAHPEHEWQNRDGSRSFRGVLSYAFPEARAHRMDEVRELQRFDIDGLFICTKSHSQHTELEREIDTYGYEAPVAEEFARRHGVDVRREDFDREAWHDLKGEFVTELLRETKAELAKRDRKLSVGVMAGRYHYFRAPTLTENHVARFTQAWRQWIDEGVVDELVVGNGQRMWSPDLLWSLPEVPWGKDDRPIPEAVAEYYADARDTPCDVLFWASWLPGTAEALNERMPPVMADTAALPVDGVVLHEAWAFEKAGDWSSIRWA